jgi:RimJ/RimL family protein N-acetyltransferase
MLESWPKDYDGYKIIRHTPSVFNLFGEYYPEKITIRRIIRFLLALPDGYEIFSLVKDGVAVGYCTVQNGKSPRFDYTLPEDIVVGPYVIMPKYQGKGLAAKLIEAVLQSKNTSYRSAYAYIKKDNIASIKTCENVGFKFYSFAEVTRFKADVKKTNDTKAHYVVYRYENGVR